MVSGVLDIESIVLTWREARSFMQTLAAKKGWWREVPKSRRSSHLDDDMTRVQTPPMRSVVGQPTRGRDLTVASRNLATSISFLEVTCIVYLLICLKSRYLGRLPVFLFIL
jgi:hypothetical protein